jgi:hypothetical protein
MPVASCSIGGKTDRLVPPELYVGRRDPVAPLLGNLVVDGSIVIPMDDVLLGWWLKAAFGAPTSSAGPTNYNHLFKIGDAMPSFIVEKQHLDVARFTKFNGLVASRLSLRLAPGDANNLLLTLETIGANETHADAKWDSGEAAQTLGNRFFFRQATITEGGGAATTLEEFELNIDFGLQPVRCLGGSGQITVVLPGTVSVTGRIKALFDGWTLPAKGVAGTESALVVTLTHGANNKLIIGIPELTYGHPAIALDGPAGQFLDLPFQGHFGNANPDKSVVYFDLYNQTASY